MKQFPHSNAPPAIHTPPSRGCDYATRPMTHAISNQTAGVSFQSQSLYAAYEGGKTHVPSKSTAVTNCAATVLGRNDPDGWRSHAADGNTNYHRTDAGSDQSAAVLGWSYSGLIVVNTGLSLSALIAAVEAEWVGGGL